MIKQITFDAFDFYLNGVEHDKQRLIALKIEQNNLFAVLKKLNWQDLKVLPKPEDRSNSMCFEVQFEQRHIDVINELKNTYSNLRYLEDVGLENFFEGDILATSYDIQIGKLDYRIHISDIAKSFRRLGLGCKIYRAILEYTDYITSEERQLSGYGKLIWNSLFFTFYTERRAFCFASDKDGAQILKVLEEKINPEYIDNMLWDEDFVERFKPLIMKSKLAILL
ncbi:hypothetical protein FBD94_09370 [Pedobacter hiemivivus]|uniref:Uncharacterized protein n=1 Tax=Pedobacter hiemivivus TaxID=2530454 RepID=A0A4U1GEQ1_9SPHI|nr:hypothetical protein [Pedobacter hiemivivus]TKC62418.1 hypothetical protein FBD94_09370 [Pedobacter hiemivivus]